MKELLQKEEKKVEYLELIYDLIFVYISVIFVFSVYAMIYRLGKYNTEN